MTSRAHQLFLIFVIALLAAIAALVFGFALTPALANDTRVGGVGGQVYPMESTDVRMEAETVQAICYRGFAEYRVDFKFVNEGDAQKLTLGFPFIRSAEPESYGTPPLAFRAWQDGVPLATKVAEGFARGGTADAGVPLGYYLQEATFSHGETMIRVSYLSVPTVSAGGGSPDLAPPEFTAAHISGWDADYFYWVHTGAGWAGTIGKTIIRFMLADTFKGWAMDARPGEPGAESWHTTKPESYTKIDERTYQWGYADYEPTENDDVRFCFARPNPWAAAGTELPKSLGAFPYILATSERLGPNSEAPMTAGDEAIDGEPNTAWGFTAGTAGWLKIGVHGDQALKEMRIVSGRNDSPTSFKQYARPKSLALILPDGTGTVVQLKDEPGVQKLAVSADVEWIEVAVHDVYPGTKSQDVYISEIDLGNQLSPDFGSFATLIAEPATPPTVPVPSRTLPTDSPFNRIYPTTTTFASAPTSTSTLPTVVTMTTTASTEGTLLASAASAPRKAAGSREAWWMPLVAIAIAAVGLGVAVVLVLMVRRSRATPGA